MKKLTALLLILILLLVWTVPALAAAEQDASEEVLYKTISVGSQAEQEAFEELLKKTYSAESLHTVDDYGRNGSSGTWIPYAAAVGVAALAAVVWVAAARKRRGDGKK